MTQATDKLDPARAQALWTVLGQPDAISPHLPPFFHHIYFWDVQPAPALGRDGHPKVGGVIPDMGFPRRMWAGGRLTFHAPVTLGHAAQKATRCTQAAQKVGRAGPLGLVTLEHQIEQDGQLCVSEEQDLVYLPDRDPDAGQPSPPKAPEGDVIARLGFDQTTLFRYSALTFNGHRIHYDVDYARDVEGYRGLVVHGPLLAQHLILAAQSALGPLEAFEFRATAPLIAGETADLVTDGSGSFWVAGPDGRQCMTATATPAA
ncbi:MAG: MaoC family dehydratase N-terminal domain-containing protein [Pseudomonadota bacterium]